VTRTTQSASGSAERQLASTNELQAICTPIQLDDGQAERFLRLLGKDPVRCWFSTITNSREPNKTRRGRDLHGFDAATLNADNTAGASVYFITGDADQATGKHRSTGKSTGCVQDTDVHTCPVLFVEWDDQTLEWQLQAWKELHLPEPTAMVSTGGKSVHCYWRLAEPMAPAVWRVLQSRLIAHAQGDPQCKNPSRLMRLPGFRYIDKATGKPTDRRAELIHQAEVSYTVAEIEACLPAPAKQQPIIANPANGYEPRSIDDIHAAAQYIPRRVGDQGTYLSDRNALCGCSAALADAGVADADGAALALLGHLWPSESAARQVLASTTTRNAASFWAIARNNGYDLKCGDTVALASTCRESTSIVAVGGKPVLLRAGEVMAALPQRLGLIRLNTRTQEIHVGDRTISGNNLSRLYLTLSSKTETWPKDPTFDAAIELAQRNSFDPISEYLQTNNEVPLPIEHWQRLDQYLFDIDDPIAAEFLPRYLMAAVARTRDPGCDFRQVPVIIGAQWIGKTALGRILFGSDYFVSGVGDLGKDALMRCHAGWGVELAELDGITRRADQEELKQFISETSDVFRLPYDKATERWPRRFLFWGTSNGAALRDVTGSSRYVCIAVDKKLPLKRVEVNRDAIWRRAVLQYEAGENWRDCDQDARDAINERNDNFSEEDPWQAVVFETLERRRKMQDLPVTMNDLLNALEIPPERRSNQASSRVQRLTTGLGWISDRRNFGGKRVRGWWPAAQLLPNHSPPTGQPPLPSQRNGSSGNTHPGQPKTKEIGKERREGGSCSNTHTPPDKSLGISEQSGWPGGQVVQIDCSATPPRILDGWPVIGSEAKRVGSSWDASGQEDDPHWPPRQSDDMGNGRAQLRLNG